MINGPVTIAEILAFYGFFLTVDSAKTILLLENIDRC
jgi:hypothetical protein